MEMDSDICPVKQEPVDLTECWTPKSKSPDEEIISEEMGSPGPSRAAAEIPVIRQTIIDLEEVDQTPSPSELKNTLHSGISLFLENEDLWAQFSEVHTEMIITKSGRRMFPCFCVSVSGLKPDLKYAMKLVFKSDEKRYKYINSKWTIAGKAESHVDEFLSYKHTDSGSSGKSWMTNKVSFKKLKLTNSKNPKKGQVSLNSMHKYTPCVIVAKYVSKKNTEIIHVQDFPQATFFAVTAYQNDQVTQLKIDNNPFAKAFRESPVDKELSSGFGISSPWTPTALSSRWALPSPLLSPSPVSPLISPRWPPSSPLINPFHGDFTQVTYSQVSPAPALPGSNPTLPQFTSVFGSWDSSPNPYAIYRPPALSLSQYQPLNLSSTITSLSQ